jgi:hypothetical protein
MIGMLYAAWPFAAAPAPWRTFHDPVHGFSLSYPRTWILAPERDGSHITLINPSTATTMSPIVLTTTATPTMVLNQAVPPGATSVVSRTVASAPAIAYLSPYQPPMTAQARHETPKPAQSQTVVVAARNRAGTTNIYGFTLIQQTDAKGHMSANVGADGNVFAGILDSLAFPATINPVASPSTQARPGPDSIIGGGGGCDVVCWADDNWNYTSYDDTSQLYCDSSGESGYYPNYSCGDGTNHDGTIVQGNGGAGVNWYQPFFQCAQFVARALTQEGAIAGLLNGGAGGYTPASPYIGSYSYSYYPFTLPPYSANTNRDLTNVNGLYHYLMDSGIVSGSLGHNVASAMPGDVVFFYDSTTLNDSTREHVMLITGAEQDGGSGGVGGWDGIVDGHNAAAYHQLIQNQQFPGFEVLHLRTNEVVVEGQPTLQGTRWNGFTDGYGQPASWVYTTNQSSPTAQARYYFSGNSYTRGLAVWVPRNNANVEFSTELANGTWVGRFNVNENNFDGWALLFAWGTLASPPTLIWVGNDNGTTTQQLGVGKEAHIC